MTYLLQIALAQDAWICVGSLGEVNFKKGTYFYVGSAKGRLKARIKRHLSDRKNIFWHIDYLLSCGKAGIRKIWVSAAEKECRIAKAIGRCGYGSINKFGSSDCRCQSHLFFTGENISRAENFLKRRGFKNAGKSSF